MEESMLKDGGLCTVTVYPDYFHVIYYAYVQTVVFLCVQTMVFLCPNSGIWCVQTMVFLCPNNGISVSKQWYFCVSKQWYLVCPNSGIFVCPNSGIFECSNNGIWCVQTMVFLCVQTVVFCVCSNKGICVCPNKGIWCVQTMVFGVFKQWYLVCSNDGIRCVQTMVFGVSKQWYLMCSNNGIWCVQTMVFGVFKRWYDCQCLGFLMCGPVLMHAAAHRGCRDILETLHRKLAQRKIACCNASCVCRTWHSPSLAMALTLPTCSLHSCICARPQCSWKRSTGYKPEWLCGGLWCQEASKPENRAKRPWIITMGHHPMYCSNTDNDDCTKDESIVSQCCGFLL